MFSQPSTMERWLRKARIGGGLRRGDIVLVKGDQRIPHASAVVPMRDGCVHHARTAAARRCGSARRPDLWELPLAKEVRVGRNIVRTKIEGRWRDVVELDGAGQRRQ